MGKPIGSFFIPFMIQEGGIFVFLQRRSDSAERNPGMTGLFGGSPEETENPEETFLRETMEELNYRPEKYFQLGVFHSGDIMHVFAEEVQDGFEDSIVIGEGKGGVFVNLEDLDQHQIPPRHSRVLADLKYYLSHRSELFRPITRS